MPQNHENNFNVVYHKIYLFIKCALIFYPEQNNAKTCLTYYHKF